MLVLLINDLDYNKRFYEERLAFFASKDEIIEVESVKAAKDFIYSQLVNGKKRIDLIITNYDFSVDRQTAVDLIIWIEGQGFSYYDSCLQLNSIPLILLHSRPRLSMVDELLGFDKIIDSKDLYNFKRIQYVIESAVKSWVGDLMSDYNLLHLDPRVPFLYGPIIWDSRCKVLAPGYADYPRRLPFLVFKRDFDAAEAAIDDFYKTVKRVSSSSRYKQEKLYHQLLKKYPEFVLGETYDKFFYEKNFRLSNNGLNNYEPDFIRRHTFFEYNNKADILEIKLPNDKFTVKSKFHPGLSSKLFRHLTQVKDYQKYFLDKANYDIIKKQLGFIPNMAHSLLLGRSSERDAHLELIEKRLNDFGSSDIVLITYDELIKQREDLLMRSSLYTVY